MAACAARTWARRRVPPGHGRKESPTGGAAAQREKGEGDAEQAGACKWAAKESWAGGKNRPTRKKIGKKKKNGPAELG